MRNFNTLAAALATASLLAFHTSAQQRPVAITNARILTMEGKAIDMGMIVTRNGKIEAVGKNVKVPPGSKIIDAKGGTVMPGLVNAYSRAGLGGGRRAAPAVNPFRRGRRRFGGFRSSRSSGPGRNNAAAKVATAIYPRQKVFRELLESGITTVALAPTGTGFPGQATLLDLTGKNRSDLIANDEMFLAVNPANNTKVKKLLKDTFAAAKKIVEERKKPKEPAKKPTTKTPTKSPAKPTTTKSKTPAKKTETPKPGPKPGPKPTPPKPTPKPKPKPKDDPKQDKTKKPAPTAKKPAPKQPAKKKNPNLEILADLLEGKRRAFISLSSATDLLHYLDAVGDTRFTASIKAGRMSNRAGEFTQVLDKVKSLKAAILMAPSLSSEPNTDHVTNPAAELHKAGLSIGFEIGDDKGAVARTLQSLIELVRHGLDEDTALAGVTLVPAKMIGVDDRVGSIKVGKAANLIVFDGDPLDPTTTLKHVLYRGTIVEKEQTER